MGGTNEITTNSDKERIIYILGWQECQNNYQKV